MVGFGISWFQKVGSEASAITRTSHQDIKICPESLCVFKFQKAVSQSVTQSATLKTEVKKDQTEGVWWAFGKRQELGRH